MTGRLGVATDALRLQALTVRALAEGTWPAVARQLHDLALPADALGDAAAGTGLAAGYAELWTAYQDLARAAPATLHEVADGLTATATGYQATDAEQATRLPSR